MPLVTNIVGRQLIIDGAKPISSDRSRALIGHEAKAEKQILRILVKQRGKVTEGAGGCMFVSGFLLFFIPVIGWILAPLFIVAGVIAMLAPQTAFKLFSNEHYENLKLTAKLAARNAYHNVACPACGARWTTSSSAFYFLKDPEGIDCGTCKKRIVRKGDEIAAV